MVQHGIVLGHEISRKEIKVDKAKVEIIAKLPIPQCVKDIRFFFRTTVGSLGILEKLLDPLQTF